VIPYFGRDAHPRCFVTTQWSVVLTAKDGRENDVHTALNQLCCTYWWPLYTFVRARGYRAHDAQDLTQEFFTRGLAKDFLRGVDPSKGKFRSFLLGAMKNFLSKEWRRSQTEKRGGKFAFVSINDETAEGPYLQIFNPKDSPENIFEKQWATTLLKEVISRLREEFEAAGEEGQFEATKNFLTGEKKATCYAELAISLGTTEGALKMAVHRMRERYRELLRAEIANTVSSPEEVEEELRALFAAVS
jgi:RNA polymerase sigma factor (sigma-70 family)